MSSSSNSSNSSSSSYIEEWSSSSSSSSSSSDSSSTSSESEFDGEIADRYIVRDDATTNKIIRNDESTNKIIRAPFLHKPTIGSIAYAQTNYSFLTTRNCVYASKWADESDLDFNTAVSKALNSYNSGNVLWERTANSAINYSTTIGVADYRVQMIGCRWVFNLYRYNNPYRKEDIEDIILYYRVNYHLGTQYPDLKISWYFHDEFPTKNDYVTNTSTLPTTSVTTTGSDMVVTIKVKANYRKYLSIFTYYDFANISYTLYEGCSYRLYNMQERWAN